MGLVFATVALGLARAFDFLKACYWDRLNSVRISIVLALIFDFLFFVVWGWLTIFHLDWEFRVFPGWTPMIISIALRALAWISTVNVFIRVAESLINK